MNKKHIILIDLPVFPKGSITLSLPAVAAIYAGEYEVEVVDLNMLSISDFLQTVGARKNVAFWGLKVSAQNFEEAKNISAAIKKADQNQLIVWGGELPTLLPEDGLRHADTVVQSLWEPVADEFISDLKNNRLKRIYTGDNKFELTNLLPPRFDLVRHAEQYYSFMGLPLETSRGCTEVCTFCMVHVMQKKNYFTKSEAQLREELKAYKGKFINIVDYNFGVSAEHVISTSRLIKESGATGWMAEMCIEFLDNDTLLAAMQKSGCRMIYCGLESIDDKALESVHKMNTNHIENYERIIRKVQSYGIQIASGFILGIEGMNERTFESTFQFFQRMGILYAKLTFLTYNPGTKVAAYMKKKGEFTTDDLSYYDGNHLSYLPHGVSAKVVAEGTENFIRQFYSFKNIVARSFNTNLSFARQLEFILFAYCFSDAYRQWLQEDVLRQPDNLVVLLKKQFKKSFLVYWADHLLSFIRKMNR